ncbi:MAG TPA: thioredoxin family protein [Bacteroidota bacterium]|nr:thioredoxin family protein [Bacteroidota bacterium]
MKRFAKLALITCILVPAYSAEIPFIKEDWHKARSMAAAQKKMLLVDFYTDWCSWCRVMDTTTFRDSAVVAFINEHFVPLSIDAEKGLGITVAMKYRVDAFPSYGYFTEDGRLVTKSIGYQPPEDYLKTLKEALARKEAGTHFEGVTSDINLNFPEFFRLASGASGERKKPEPGVVDAYLESQTDLFGEVNFSVICRFKTSDKVTDFFLANRDKYVKLYGSDDVDMKISSVTYERLRAAIGAKDKSLLEKTLELSDRYGTGDREENRSRLTMSYYGGVKEWPAYSAMVDNAIKSGKMSDAGVNAAAWTLYEQCDDRAIIRMAAGWMSKTIVTSPVYAYLDTYAALLYKDGQTKLAEEFAVKAIEKGKRDKEDVKSTEELLRKIKGEIQ